MLPSFLFHGLLDIVHCLRNSMEIICEPVWEICEKHVIPVGELRHQIHGHQVFPPINRPMTSTTFLLKKNRSYIGGVKS